MTIQYLPIETRRSDQDDLIEPTQNLLDAFELNPKLEPDKRITTILNEAIKLFDIHPEFDFTDETLSSLRSFRNLVEDNQVPIKYSNERPRHYVAVRLSKTGYCVEFLGVNLEKTAVDDQLVYLRISKGERRCFFAKVIPRDRYLIINAKEFEKKQASV